MFTWHKLGKVFDPFELQDNHRPWMQEFAQAPATLIFDDFVRVYFSCRPARDENGKYVSYSAYVDLDRRDLKHILCIAEQPILPLGKKGCFDEFGTYPVSVINRKDKQEIWGYYAGWTRCESTPFTTAIGIAISKDQGKTFTRLGDGPLLGIDTEDPFALSGPKIRYFNSKFYLFYISISQWILADQMPEFSSQIKVAISDDGLNWQKIPDPLIVQGGITQDESQASPDVIFSHGRYHMFFCHWDPHTFRHTQYRRIGYAVSNDLIHWERNDAKAGIDVSTDGFDNEMIAYPHVFALDGKIYMLYLGNSVGRHGFGLAELEGELI